MAEMIKIGSGANYTLYRVGENKLIKIENIRFSYPHLGVQQEQENDDGTVKKSWGGVAMLSKKTHVAAKEAFMKILEELQTKNKVKVPPEYRCIKDGNDKDDETMHGHWLIAFADQGKRRPGIRDRDASAMVDADEIDDKFYGGCYGSVLLRPWFFNGTAKRSKSGKTYPKRLVCGFNGVQFLRDGEPFGQGRVDDSAAWADESDTSDDGMGNNTQIDDDDF